MPLIGSGYADEAIAHRLPLLYGMKLPLEENFAVSTSEVATILALGTCSDALVPSTDVAMVPALRKRSVVRIDVNPALDPELTLGIVERGGRTHASAATHAFELVPAHFAAVGAEVGGLEPALRRLGSAAVAVSPLRAKRAIPHRHAR